MLHERFTVEATLGRGRLATVYRAYDTLTRRTVALKVFERLRDLSGHQRACFVGKGRALARLDHSNLVRVYDASVDGHVPYLVLEYVDGEDLSSWAAQSSGLADWDTVRFVAAGVLQSLAYLHHHQVLHRDIRPANVIVTTDPLDRGSIQSVKLAEPGLAHTMDALAHPGSKVAGTMRSYLAPECVRGAAPSITSDLFAVGALLYELAVGFPPFDGTFDERYSSPPIPLGTLRPDLPPRLNDFVAQLLERDPHVRPASAVSARRTLEAIAADEGIHAHRLTDARTAGRQRLEQRTTSTPTILQFPISRARLPRSDQPTARQAHSR